MGFRDLKCRNRAQNRNLREKLSKIGPVEKFWLWSKSTVNGQSQRSIADVCWRGSVTSPRADVAGRDVAAGVWVRVVWRVGARGARAREAETSSGAWGRVWCSFWLFLVGFCSGLAVLSFYAYSLAVECVERWYLSVAVLWPWRQWFASDSDDWIDRKSVV